jgi:branched-chain amino acid aminotransferase
MDLFADRFTANNQVLGQLFDRYVFIDGRFVRGSEAKVSIWDHSYLYGDSVFEGVRAYGGRIFKLHEHVRRLFESAKSIRIVPPVGPDELEQVVLQTFRINELREGHGRVTISRGVGRMGLDPRNCKTASVTAMAYELPPTYGEKPIRLTTSAVRRKGPVSVDAKIKCSNYMDNILAKLQAIAAGTEEALILDSEGHVAEATAENVFVVKEGEVCTPFTDAALEGITRQTIMDLCRENGIPAHERTMTPHDLYVADEVFLTGTAAEVAAVGEIDGRTIGAGKMGEMTSKVRALYKNHVLAGPGSAIF